MGQGTEHERGVAERGIIGGDELNGTPTDTRPRTTLVVGGRECELELRMIENERAQLASGVAARAQDSHGCSIHQECIIMREG